MYFATSSSAKFNEFRRILGIGTEQLNVELEEIQAIDVSAVVIHKAMQAYEKVTSPVIVEDTGLYINAFGGFPGALVKWLLKSIGNEGIVKMLNNYEDKSAYAESCICLYNGNKPTIFSGRANGIITAPKGENGFGWDPIFMAKGKTFAEMTDAEKDAVSMRRIAIEKLKSYISEDTKQ